MTETQEVAEVEVVAAAAPAEVEERTSIAVPMTPELAKLRTEAAMLEVAFTMAQSLSKTTAVPQRYQQSFVPKGEREPLGIRAAHSLAAAILYGSELGMTALQAAQNVFDVHGQPAVYARTMVAQVRAWIDKRIAQGLTTTDLKTGDAIWEVSASPTSVVWAARRDGREVSSEWTPRRAETAGFTKNEKYQKQPTEMLRAKAMTETCRILFQDVLLGMAYSVEELQLEHGVSVQVIRPATKAKGVGGLEAMLAERKQAAITAESRLQEAESRAAAAQVDAERAEEPTVEEPPAQEPSPATAEAEAAPGGGDEIPPSGSSDEPPAPVPVSKPQLTEVKRLLARETFTNPKAPDTLAYVAQMVSLDELASLESLTSDQADEVIRELSK
ncbi:hypothetical protein [Mycolicibacterium fortuitum]|uniref:hypothetical protein n=1 Tax=Mycolicibacterium fortuitum TaxID=1766 RepID=UPI0007EB3DC0|nr:hypothetical protein [Mycolicibacterium fortuitum]OBF77021.1 hypothetical protein A5751_22840 [Mycolicibacterium fortuitum]